MSGDGRCAILIGWPLFLAEAALAEFGRAVAPASEQRSLPPKQTQRHHEARTLAAQLDAASSERDALRTEVERSKREARKLAIILQDREACLEQEKA